MNGEDGRANRARPKCVGRLPQEGEQEKRHYSMQAYIDQMMRTGIQTEKLAIDHVGNRRQWMPVLRMNMSEGPDDAAPGQSDPDIRIVENVRAVVIVNETEVPGLEEDKRNQSGQAEIDGDKSSSLTTHLPSI